LTAGRILRIPVTLSPHIRRESWLGVQSQTASALGPQQAILSLAPVQHTHPAPRLILPRCSPTSLLQGTGGPDQQIRKPSLYVQTIIKLRQPSAVTAAESHKPTSLRSSRRVQHPPTSDQRLAQSMSFWERANDTRMGCSGNHVSSRDGV